MIRLKHILFLIMTLSFSSCVFPEAYFPEYIKLKVGDNPAWAAKDLNDIDWDSTHHTREVGRFWIRAKIDFDSLADPEKPLGIFIVSIGSFEFYFDGQLIGKNGKIGNNKREEIPGSTISYFLIPDTLAYKGNHTIALRVSNFHSNERTSFFQFVIANYFQLVRKPLILTAFMYILAGVFFIVAIYYFFLYLKYKEELIVLVFSVSCFVFFALIILEYLKFYVLYPYPYQYARMDLIRWLTVSLAGLVPFFFNLQFPFSKNRLYLGLHLCLLLILVVLFYRSSDTLSQMTSLLMWISSTIIVGVAAIKNEKGSEIVLTGLLSCGIFVYYFHYDISLFLSFGMVIILMLFLLAIRMQEQEKAYESSKLLSARLQMELLKKNIQPHFLMNTLTSLIDWIEESPDKGISFIESLAKEFNILSRIANKSLIRVDEEIDLCKTHLQVMTFRKEIDYRWADEGIDPTEMIPPALIHTALENGITHSLPLENGAIIFHLSFEKQAAFKRYTLKTFGQRRRTNGKRQEGTGIQYMKARLQESYESNWKLSSEAVKEGWQTTITIYDFLL